MREIIAAQFRDRVVHHLLYNYIYDILVKQFIQDSYSCIKGRGTHYGIERLREKIIRVSKNYSCPCYILKLDIEGYFMHIDRAELLSLCKTMLEPYKEQLDYELVIYLLETIVLKDPLENCIMVGSPKEREGLPDKKTLTKSPPGKGLPIGNLTSQLLSNIFMDVFDKYMEHITGGGCYGRYVDDSYVVGDSVAALCRIIPLARSFLRDVLGLTLNETKTAIYSAYRGVEFLGAYLKPYRTYVSNSCKKRMNRKIRALRSKAPKDVFTSVNSYLGITSHYAAYNLRKEWMKGPLSFAFGFGYFTSQILTFKLQKSVYCSLTLTDNLGK
ncbi:MAG: RNA-directed DNA polymerase [Bacteroidales bacterium]|nr:RNA-directed DNA polymerase [Bacteroidales bacterium]